MANLPSTPYVRPATLAGRPRGGTALGFLGATALTLTVMLATEPRLAIVWDEGYTLGREARLRLWFRAMKDPARFAADWQPPTQELVQQRPGERPPRPDQVNSRSRLLFDPQILAWFWPFAREEPHGHPPLYALIGLAGDVLTPWRADLARARLGPMILFSLTAGFLFAFTHRRWGLWPACAATCSWVLQPNLFAHGHYATYDAILSSFWLLAIIAFIRAVEDDSGTTRNARWLKLASFGVVLGFAADTKLTGWVVSLPFLAWVAIYRSRRGMVTLLAGGAIAGFVLYLINPPWWGEPIAGVTRFFVSNLNRAQTIRIKTMFLGQVYSTPDGSLPWYNTAVWTALVTPVGFLVLALLGAWRALARIRSEPFGPLILGHWVFLLLLRALPHTPGHDGVRQMLPAFGILAFLVAPGTALAVEKLGRWGRAAGFAATAEGLLSVALMMPVPLSYFSPLVGGLPGAVDLGMEPTYYWDSLSPKARSWLRQNTPAGRKVRFATFPTSWLYLRDQGELPQGLLPNDPGQWAWYVVQNRPGAFSSLDRSLSRSGTPAYTVQKWGVPLLWVFPYSQVEQSLEAAGGVGAAVK